MKRKAILSIALAGMLAFGAGLGTMAWFTSSTTSQANVFQAGELKIAGPGWNGVAEDVVDVTNIYPGWEEQKTVNIQNTGSLAFQYRVSAESNNNSLLFNGSHRLQVKVNDGEFMPINQFKNVALGAINAESNKDITFTFKLPTSADDNYQKLVDSFNFVFEATQVENGENGWQALELERTVDSGKNAENKSLNRPHVNHTINGNKITLEFVNPTSGHYSFFYRVDGEEGITGDYSDVLIKESELAGEKIGLYYNSTYVAPNTTKTVTVTATEEVLVGLRLGGEHNYYFDWIKFEVK